MEEARLWVHGEPLAPPPVVGWRLALLRDGKDLERRECGGETGFNEAQHIGRAWLQQHRGDSVDAFTALATQAARRMRWDHDYRHDISKRGF